MGRNRFARSAFADDADNFAFTDVQRDVFQGMHDGAAGTELDAEVLDVEDRDAVLHAVPPLGPPARIDEIAQTVAEKIETEHRQH